MAGSEELIFLAPKIEELVGVHIPGNGARRDEIPEGPPTECIIKGVAGYSDTPLVQKLGIKEGMAVSIFNAPNYFELDLGELPDEVEVFKDADDQPSDLYLIFADRSDEAQRGFERAITHLPSNGAIWIAWPKKSSDRASDLTEDTLRELFLPSGMVDNKVCAIDETWSGLRFVVRKENRDDWPRQRRATD